MAEDSSERLVLFVHDELEVLLRELQDIRQSIGDRRFPEAHEAMTLWSRRLARHLDWSEKSLLPAFTRCRAARDSRALDHHVDDRRELARTATALLERLSPGAGCGQEAPGLALLDRLRSRLAALRDRELHGVCSVLDETLPPAAIRRLEREHAL